MTRAIRGRQPRSRAVVGALVAVVIGITGWISIGSTSSAAGASGAASGAARATPGNAREYLKALRSHITHVVVMIQENHTFDSVLGDGCATTHHCRGIAVGSSVRLSSGAAVTVKQAADRVAETDHSFEAQQAAWNNGHDNGWQEVAGCEPPGYRCLEEYRRSQVPAIWSLATGFAVSDNTFTCNPTSSWGDHFTWQTACNLDGFKGSIPVKGTTGGGITWGCRSGRLEPWSANGRAPFQLVPACNPDPTSGLPHGGASGPTPVRTLRTLGQTCDQTAGCARASYNTALIWSTDESHAYLALHRNLRRGTSQFLTDARRGHLPGLSILTPSMPGGESSQHNGSSMAVGDRAIATAAQAVMNGPQWNSTALFITYDDCGCFYDHVAPNRVPLVVVSPWVKRGSVDSTRTTFAGVQAFIENVFAMPRLNAADRSAYAYQHSFDFQRAPLPPLQLPQAGIPAASRDLAKPGFRGSDPGDPS